MLVFNAPRELTATLYKLRARTMHENVHAWSRIRSQRYIIIYHVILCIYSWTLNRSIHCSRIKHDMLQCTTWMFWYIQFITNKHFTTQLSSIVFRTKRLFADDAIIYKNIKARNDVDILQKDLTLLEKWEKHWRMEFNPSKYNSISFTRLRNPITHTLTSSDPTRKIIISKIFRSHSVGKTIMVRTRNKHCKQSKSCPRNDQKKYKCCSYASQVTSLPDTSTSTSWIL